jgi:hypothetical protein
MGQTDDGTNGKRDLAVVEWNVHKYSSNSNVFEGAGEAEKFLCKFRLNGNSSSAEVRQAHVKRKRVDK